MVKLDIKLPKSCFDCNYLDSGNEICRIMENYNYGNILDFEEMYKEDYHTDTGCIYGRSKYCPLIEDK